MTVGKDVSPLFQPVIKCLEYHDIELKKLVYLYIINYSRTRPDDAIMVNLKCFKQPRLLTNFVKISKEKETLYLDPWLLEPWDA